MWWATYSMTYFLHHLLLFLNACLPCLCARINGRILIQKWHSTCQVCACSFVSEDFSITHICSHAYCDANNCSTSVWGFWRDGHLTGTNSSSRFDDPDGGLESEEFLPNMDGKKPIRFTDVSVTFIEWRPRKHDTSFSWVCFSLCRFSQTVRRKDVFWHVCLQPG